jgi:8-oxoguanine deaminase
MIQWRQLYSAARRRPRYTVMAGKVVVENGRVATIDMRPIVEQHNRFALKLAAGK